MATTTFTAWLDPSYLNEISDKNRNLYAAAHPFPHIVIDNFFPESVLDEVLSEFPQPESIDWKKFNAPSEKKLASKSEIQIGSKTRYLLYQLNSSIFIDFLEKLTGIEGIIPDPHFVGGGLHQIQRGGFLKIHADFNRHRRLKLDRRLNLLVYLNKNWKEEYGGHFELWDQDMNGCEKKILPIFNRCVIFSTTDFSFHGHPDPLMCPEEWTRKSLALYYYSNGRPQEEVSGKHSTLFQARPQENLETTSKKSDFRQLIKKCIPPIIIDTADYLSNKK